MPMTIDQIVNETRSLPRDVVAELVDRILMESHGGQNAEHSAAWSAVVHSRIGDIRSGKIKGIPAEQSSKKIRQIVGR
ncbi:hypothetical protein M2103_001587 [Ereboglobus sp. PH5-5]|nr:MULTISPECIES: addiction module protein [Ereboglobus]MDF9833363.1 hypothetical protein [Ereboglobus sp. PH5-5]